MSIMHIVHTLVFTHMLPNRQPIVDTWTNVHMYKHIYRHLSIHSKPLNENTSDNEWMILGILLHWDYSIDWLTLVWCICEHMHIWTNETPLSVSKIFNIQKGEPFSTGGGIIITNPRPYHSQHIWTNLSHTYKCSIPHNKQWSTNLGFI